MKTAVYPVLSALLASGWLLAYKPAAGQSRELNGIKFTAASDNVSIRELSGQGTLSAPFVLIEEITGNNEAVLEINITARDFGSRIRSMHAVGFALTKIVVNKTLTPWDYFAMELEFEHGAGSDYLDGLSFAQSATANRPYLSDRFSRVEDITEPRDMLRYSGGTVAPGEQVSFTFSITHTGRLPRFLLVQHIRRPYADNERADITTIAYNKTGIQVER